MIVHHLIPTHTWQIGKNLLVHHLPNRRSHVYENIITSPENNPSIQYNHHHHDRDPNLSLWWSTISVRLVGSHPLWGHHLWNAARALASFFQRNSELYLGRTVLKLGAGSGLPGLVTAKCGVQKLIVSVRGAPHGLPGQDSPRQFGLQRRPDRTASAARCRARSGDTVAESDADADVAAGPDTNNFDLILLSDLIFNHSQHRALLTACERTIITPGGCVLVFYTHHRPHVAHRDMEFFEIAGEMGWEREKVLTE